MLPKAISVFVVLLAAGNVLADKDGVCLEVPEMKLGDLNACPHSFEWEAKKFCFPKGTPQVAVNALASKQKDQYTANLAVWTTEYCLNFMESWCVGMGGTLKKDRLNANICDVPCEWINSQVNAEVDAGIATSTACSTDADCAADFLNPLDQSVESPFVAKFQEAVDGWCCSRLKKDTNEMCSGVSEEAMSAGMNMMQANFANPAKRANAWDNDNAFCSTNDKCRSNGSIKSASVPTILAMTMLALFFSRKE